MLQTIREHTQGWIAGTIISIIILTFALWGIHSYFIGGTVNNIVAKVNQVEITKEQLSVAYERVRRQVQLQFGPNKAIQNEAELKNRALQALINIEVLKQAAIDEGFYISDRQVDNYLQSIPEFQIEGRFSVQRFQDVLASSLLSTSEFLDLIKTSLLIDQPKTGIVFTAFSLPDETRDTIGLVNQERDFDYITLSLNVTLSQPISISSKRIEDYYKSHQNEFMTPEQVSIEYIEIGLNDIAATINPTDETLENVYKENINSYKVPLQWKLDNIVIPIPPAANSETLNKAQQQTDAVMHALENGEDFTKLAQDNSQDTSLIGWLALNQIPAELQKSIMQLTAPNQLSAPIKTNKGFVIVKVLEIRQPYIQDFESVKNKVKEIYVRQHAEEKLAELREQLANMTYEHPESLAFAAKAFNLPVKTSEFFTKDQPGKDIARFKSVRTAAFSNDVLNLQNNSDVIQINPETLVVLRDKAHNPSALLPLEKVSKQIEEKLKEAEAEQRLEKLAEDIKAKLQAGENPQQLAASYKLTWNTAGLMGRYSTKVDSAIIDAAFSLPNPSLQKAKVVYGMTKMPNGYAIVALKAVKEGSYIDNKQYTVFAEQVQNSDGLLEYELYKQSLINSSKVTIEKR